MFALGDFLKLGKFKRKIAYKSTGANITLSKNFDLQQIANLSDAEKDFYDQRKNANARAQMVTYLQHLYVFVL